MASSPFAPASPGCVSAGFYLSLPPLQRKGPRSDNLKRAGIRWMQLCPDTPEGLERSEHRFPGFRARCGEFVIFWLMAGAPRVCRVPRPGPGCCDTQVPSSALPGWKDVFLLAVGWQSLLPVFLWDAALPQPPRKPRPQWIPPRCHLPAQPPLPRARPCRLSSPSSSAICSGLSGGKKNGEVSGLQPRFDPQRPNLRPACCLQHPCPGCSVPAQATPEQCPSPAHP